MICRSCGELAEPMFTLGKLPLVNSLLSSPREPFEKYPLDMMLCSTCLLGQLRDSVSPEKMFREYLYYSAISGPTIESAKLLVRRLTEGMTDRKNALVMEIGSNDGYLLQFYREQGIQVLGVDPARGPANAAALRGIPTIQDFLTLKLSRQLPKADIIHANNVLAHVPELNDFVAALSEVLKPNGTCVVEVPYLGDLLEKCEFDTVYHEHQYYFSRRSLESLFGRHGLFVANAESLASHGGSLRLTLRKDGPHAMTITDAIPADHSDMQKRITIISNNLKTVLTDLRQEGKRVWGFGAAAKATVMLNYCGIDNNLIEAVADSTPAKIGMYIPGTGIEIRHPEKWIDVQPDYTCIFAWNYAHEIKRRYAQEYLGRFFTPYALPERF